MFGLSFSFWCNRIFRYGNVAVAFSVKDVLLFKGHFLFRNSLVLRH